MTQAELLAEHNAHADEAGRQLADYLAANIPPPWSEDGIMTAVTTLLNGMEQAYGAHPDLYPAAFIVLQQEIAFEAFERRLTAICMAAGEKGGSA
jgi:hypothetical protein